MITKWKVSNFKSIRNKTTLDLGPVTILAGANNSGKSTWLQTMLLVSQTLASKVIYRPVILNGQLTRLGQFSDVMSVGSEDDSILIGWECEPHITDDELLSMESPPYQIISYFAAEKSGPDRLSCEFEFDVSPSGHHSDVTQPQPRLKRCEVSCSSRPGELDRSDASISVNRTEDPASRIVELNVGDDITEAMRSSLAYEVHIDGASLRDFHARSYASATAVGCEFNHFLPSRLTVRYDEIAERKSRLEEALFGSRYLNRRLHYQFSIMEDIVIPEAVLEVITTYLNQHSKEICEALFPSSQMALPLPEISSLTVEQWFERVQHLPLHQRRELQKHMDAIEESVKRVIHTPAEPRYQLVRLPLPESLTYPIVYLNGMFSRSIRYVGPLRDEPKPLYPLSTAVDPSDVGLRGEFTAAVLDLHRNKVVTYIPSANFESPSIKPEPRSATLRDAVLDWCQYMGVARGISTRDMGKLGHEFAVRVSDAASLHDLTHVGVGVSQVLPILVACLLAEVDTTLVFEQPEIHLQPRVQSLLADFFLSMTYLGKQCILETHSEYLVNRMRLRAASGESDEISSKIRLYFVENQDNGSVFRNVPINEYGAMIDWPEGFFDQSLREAESILLAATRKRRDARKGSQRA